MSLLNTGKIPTSSDIWIADKQLNMLIRREIRDRFDKALTDIECLTWIEVAKAKRFHHLAKEMQIDLETELRTY